MEDRMSLLFQLASCFLAFLSEAEVVLKSVEKVRVLVDPVRLKSVKERSIKSLSLPIPLFSCLPIQVSGEVFPPISSARIQRTEEYAQQSGGHMTNPINKRVPGQKPFCPPLPLKGCLALPRPLATMVQSISCQKHSAQGRRQNLTRTIKTSEIFMDPCGLHFFILPEAFAQQKSQLFCLYYETHREKKDL